MSRTVLAHVTRMNGDRVCLAGVDELGQHIRPLLPSGHWREADLRPDGPLQLGTVVEVQGRPRPDPPHCEDLVLDRWTPLERLPYATFLERLERAVVDFGQCFGGEQQVLPGQRLVLAPGTGTSSLHVVMPGPSDLYCRQDALRLAVEHPALGTLVLPVTDLRYRPWTPRRGAMAELSEEVAAGRALLAVGLTHAYGYPDRWCWTQVNGIFVEDPGLTGW